MDEFEKKLHRTWVQALVEFNLPSMASVAIDTQLIITTEEYQNFNESVSVPRSIILDVPISTYAFVKKNEETIKKTLRGVCQGHIHDSNGGKINVNELDIEFRQESNDDSGQRIQALNNIVVIVVPHQAGVRGHLA